MPAVGAVAVAALALLTVGRAQDLLIGYSDRLEVLDPSLGASKTLIPLAPNVSVVQSLTSANRIASAVFVTDYSSAGSDIYFVNAQGSAVPAQRKRVFQGSTKGDADSIAFDTKRSALLVANNSGRAITRFFVDGRGVFSTAEPEILVPLSPDCKVRHVKYDTCSDRIYWLSRSSSSSSSGGSPTIESCAGSGTDRRQIVSSGLVQPSSLAVDPWLRQLLWIDVGDAGDFRLERADLDGGSRRVVCRGRGQAPFDMAVDGEAVFWSDWKSMIVWKMKKSDISQDGSDECKMTAFKRLSRARPMGMLMLLDAEAACSSYVASTAAKRPATESAAMTTREEQAFSSPCHNYCLRGSCALTAANIPVCSCERGFGGARCQTDLCANFCFQGVCNVDGNGPLCVCPEGVSGKRCQIAAVLPSPSFLVPLNAPHYEPGSGPSLVTTSLSLLLLMCVLAICAMSAYIWRQLRSSRHAHAASASLPANVNSGGKKKRRTFSGPKAQAKQDAAFDAAVGSGHCVMDGGDGVVIDVEDCCQMTICDKPCVEASFRKATNRKNARHSASEDREVLLNDDLLAFGRTGI